MSITAASKGRGCARVPQNVFGNRCDQKFIFDDEDGAAEDLAVKIGRCYRFRYADVRPPARNLDGKAGALPGRGAHINLMAQDFSQTPDDSQTQAAQIYAA